MAFRIVTYTIKDITDLGVLGAQWRARERERDFRVYPKYKNAYLLAFEKMLEYREKHKVRWRQGASDYNEATAMDVYNWWMETKNLVGQINLFEEEGL